MSKTDFNRDYYADLELSPSADINDIKKQFRKLALKYHPDRNPGKETEVNAKFQTIQAAHEILSSPEQKSKYDAHRSRKPPSRFPAGSGVRGNPWQDVADQYPTPPRRPGQAPTSAARGYASSTAPRTPGAASASAGPSAHRYSGFSQPQTAKASRDTPDTRYQAWKNMRPVPKTPRPGQSASAAYASGADARTYGGAGRPPTSASTASAASAAASSMPPPPPRTPSQKQKAEASFGARRTPGFFPRSPMGDEPPAASTSNYFTSRSRSSNFDDRAARPDGQSGRTTPTGPPRTYGARPADTTDEPCVDARQSTPYQTHGGEKFDPFDGVPFPDMSRTRSQRAPAAQERPSSRRRSSSLPDEADNMGKATAKDTAGNDAGAGPGGPGPGAGSRAGTRTRTGPGLRHKFSTSSTPMPQFDMHYRMRKEEDDPPTTPAAKSTLGNQRGTPADIPGRTPASAADGPILYATPHLHPHLHPHPPAATDTPLKTPPPAKLAGGKGAGVQRPTPAPGGASHASESEKPRPRRGAPFSRPFPSGDAGRGHKGTGIAAFESKQFEILQDLVRNVEVFAPHTGSSDAPDSRDGQVQHERRRRRRLPESHSRSLNSHADPAAYYSSSKFSFAGEPAGPASPETPSQPPRQPPRQPGRFMSSSAEGINTRFVAGEHANAAWTFSAGGSDSGSSDSLPSRMRRSQSGSRIGRQSPARDFTAAGVGSVPPSSRAAQAAQAAQATPPRAPPRPPRPMFATAETHEKQPVGGVEEGGGFNAEKWTEQIGLEHFVPQFSATPQAPPRKATPTQFSARPSKKPRPVRSATRTFVVDDSGDSTAESGAESARPAQPTEAPMDAGFGVGDGAAFASPGAMDIDSPGPTAIPERTGSPKAASATAQADGEADGAADGAADGEDAPATGVRNIPVEPSRPEWRAGDVKNAAAEAPANGGTVGGSEDSDEFIASLADMKKVEPFAEGKVGAPGSGLGSFSDLRSTLPFESRSAVNPPVQKPERKRNINFPKAPTAPHPPPALAVPGLQPSGAAWETYVAEFRHYMQAWTEFNNLYVDHFLARRNAVEKQRRDGSFAWLTALGDDGIAEYLDWMDQDDKVRTAWSESCVGHEQTVRQFMAFRDRMK